MILIIKLFITLLLIFNIELYCFKLKRDFVEFFDKNLKKNSYVFLDILLLFFLFIIYHKFISYNFYVFATIFYYLYRVTTLKIKMFYIKIYYNNFSTVSLNRVYFYKILCNIFYYTIFFESSYYIMLSFFFCHSFLLKFEIIIPDFLVYFFTY